MATTPFAIKLEVMNDNNDMRDSIKSLISDRILPMIDPDGIYMIILRGDFYNKSEFRDYNEWLKDWYGYHNYFLFNSTTTLKFAVIDDPNQAPIDLVYKCSSINPEFSSANDNFGADSMITTYAHEIAEVITDPFGNAWNFGTYDDEIADNKCTLNLGCYDENKNSSTQIGEKNVLIIQQKIFQRGVITINGQVCRGMM